MKIIDLTHVIKEGMPVFPGTEGPQLKPACLYESHGFREMLLSMYSHTGTHMDAPAHMLENGLTLDALPVEQFIGSAVVVDVRAYEKEIPRSVFEALSSTLEKVDFVLIRTDWDLKWGQATYFQDFPALSVEAAHYLTTFNLKGFGVDAISVDLMTSKTFEVHNILLSKNMVMIENLKGLKALGKAVFTLSVLPLKTEYADGSPIRAVAIVNTP